jgi:serine/threonine protein kinase
MLNILDYLHKCKIVHFDIKPDNFVIDTLPNEFDYFTQKRTRCLVLIDFNQSIDWNEQEFHGKEDKKTSLHAVINL